MKRLPGWRLRMAAHIDRVKLRPFGWGTADCGPEFVGIHVAVMTGADLAAPFRFTYSDEAGAAAVIAAAGFTDLAELVSSLLPEWLTADGGPAPSMARAGDIGAVPHPSPLGYGLGIVLGERVLVVGEKGCATVDRRRLARAWRVGDA